ncbi:UAA transporter [Mycotypha africana]|uniref:UAA transporter n=1 Tax=Mycotypha africana TaxID=64632 RepID=UPI002300915A|nr:UAA transporter [Mycotypha africana]KAI8988126.1 UAA transporter [Mycotypha africana]
MLRFALCVIGIYTCFLTWGVVQERVTTTAYGGDANTPPKKFKYFIVLNLIQSLIAAFVAFIYLKACGRQLHLKTTPRELYLKYGQVALFNCMGSPFGYAALKHIDYPTMILGKSCKLVPVLVMNVLVYRRRFPLHKYVCVLLVTLGVSLFMLCQPVSAHKANKGPSTSSLWGLFLLSMNLMIDGLTNATQDQIFVSRFRTLVSGQHMMFFMNAIGSVYSACYLFFFNRNELLDALRFFEAHPVVIRDVFLFGFCGAVGQCFIFYTLQHYGSLRLVTVTVTRKLFTMLLSVFWFNHQLVMGQWTGVVLVFTAIGIEAYVGKKQKKAKKLDHANDPSIVNEKLNTNDNNDMHKMNDRQPPKAKVA